MKLSVNFLLKILVIIYTILLILKSILNQLTYDEAYTYLNYVLTKNYFNIGLANNHLLNTILIAFTTKFSSQEFYIRLPNIIFGVIFVISVYLYSLRSKYPILSFFIIISSPRMFDFFTLGRGYGISTTLLFLAFFIFFKTNFRFKYFISYWLLLLSSLSINIYIVVFFVFVLVTFKEQVIYNYKYLFFNFIISIFPVFIVCKTVFTISTEGKPLYGFETIELTYQFKTFFGLVATYGIEGLIIEIIVTVSLLSLFYKNIRFVNNQIWLIFIISIILLYSLPFLFGRPFPGGRLLLPLLSIFLFTVVEMVNIVEIKALSKLLIIFYLIFNFMINFSFNETRDWEIVNICNYPYVSEYYEIYKFKNFEEKCIGNNF